MAAEEAGSFPRLARSEQAKEHAADAEGEAGADQEMAGIAEADEAFLGRQAGVVLVQDRIDGEAHELERHTKGDDGNRGEVLRRSHGLPGL